MNREDVTRVARWLNGLGLPYVVVGGSAIESTYSVGTKDVNVLIAVGAWGDLDRAIKQRREATPLEPRGDTIRGSIVTIGTQRVDVEFISGQPFCGNRLPEDFVEYVRSRHSRTVDGVRYADAAVVWYMRLSVETWNEYVYRLEADLRAGVPRETFDIVLTIAGHFGNRAILAQRVTFARKTLSLFDPPEVELPHED